MQAKEAIELLRENYSPDDEVTMAWWDVEIFNQEQSPAWNAFVARVESRTDWSDTYDYLASLGES